ncbi:FecR/PupR family sigma factor regulator, partial [Pseudomonas helleri]
MTPDATAERIRQQAADWAVRQRMERLDAQQMDALERWLDADPAHADALADAEMLWEMAETLRANPLFATPVPVARATRVRRFLRGLFTW